MLLIIDDHTHSKIFLITCYYLFIIVKGGLEGWAESTFVQTDLALFCVNYTASIEGPKVCGYN